jgi:hypothetical protein
LDIATSDGFDPFLQSGRQTARRQTGLSIPLKKNCLETNRMKRKKRILRNSKNKNVKPSI